MEQCAQPHLNPDAADWTAGQRFTTSDDPDRMTFQWRPPQFVSSKDPVSQRSRTTVEQLTLPAGTSGYMSMPIRSFASLVHGVLEPDECSALLEEINKKGYTPALINVGGGTQQFDPKYRSSKRCIVDTPEFANYLYKVLDPYLPDTFCENTRAEMQKCEVNERCRFLCYTPGDEFSAHCDGCYYRPDGHPKRGSKSLVTVQVYLHDLPEYCGGATTFIGSSKRLKVQPRCGSVLLFSQDLYHEGSRLTDGLKYVVRTEVMYDKPAANKSHRATVAAVIDEETAEAATAEELADGQAASPDTEIAPIEVVAARASPEAVEVPNSAPRSGLCGGHSELNREDMRDNKRRREMQTAVKEQRKATKTKCEQCRRFACLCC